MTITSATGRYTRTVTSDSDSGTVLCPVHWHSVYKETAELNGAAQSDLVRLLVDDVRGEHMLTSAFGANLRGTATLSNTYTATGDPEVCPRPPRDEVIPSEFQPFWSCGSLGTFEPGSNVIAVDATVHDRTNPPGTTHYRLSFARQ